MELNFASFDEVDELQSHVEKYSEYFCEYHYFHLIKVDGEIVGLVVESLM